MLILTIIIVIRYSEYHRISFSIIVLKYFEVSKTLLLIRDDIPIVQSLKIVGNNNVLFLNQVINM